MYIVALSRSCVRCSFLSWSLAVDSAPVNDDCDVVCLELSHCCRSQRSLFGPVCSTDHEGNIGKNAKLEHNVAVVFDHADFSAQNIACGLSTECMEQHAGDRHTIII